MAGLRVLRLASPRAAIVLALVAVAASAAADHRDGIYLVARAGARPVKVISGVRGPLGLTWLRGRLYVASLGRVDAFSGLHGTRFVKRTPILKEPSGHDGLAFYPGTSDLLVSMNQRDDLGAKTPADCSHTSPRATTGASPPAMARAARRARASRRPSPRSTATRPRARSRSSPAGSARRWARRRSSPSGRPAASCASR